MAQHLWPAQREFESEKPAVGMAEEHKLVEIPDARPGLARLLSIVYGYSRNHSNGRTGRAHVDRK